MASGKTIHSAGINETHQVPMRIINRPVIPKLDEEKVKSLMKTIKVREINESPVYVLKENVQCQLKPCLGAWLTEESNRK